MVDLNTQFRQNAPFLNDGVPPSKEIFYLRNTSLQNKRIKFITKANNLLGKSKHVSLIDHNNANTVIESDDTYGYLETCISPYMITSDFDLVFISSRLVNRFRAINPDTVVDNRALSKVITAAAEQVNGVSSYTSTVYFDYSEETVLYQTVVIGILKSKVDKAIELNRSRTDTVLTISDADGVALEKWTINRILSEALLDGGNYYIPINLANETKVHTYTVHSTLDRTGTYFSEVTKRLQLNVTKNNISPYALYKLEPYDLSAEAYTRTINGATLPSKAYNNRKYVQYMHEARPDAVEVHITYTNNSNGITYSALTPEFGTYDDDSYIIKRTIDQTGSTTIRNVYVIKNALFIMQYLIPLTSNDTLWFTANHVSDISYGQQATDAGKVTTYGSGLYSGLYHIKPNPIGLNQAIYIRRMEYFINKRDALRFNISSGVYSGTGKTAYVRDRALRNAKGETVESELLAYNTVDYRFMVERISGGVNVWVFKVNDDPINGFVTKFDIVLPMFTADEPLYIISTDLTTATGVLDKGTGYDFSILEADLNSKAILTSSTTMLTDVGNV